MNPDAHDGGMLALGVQPGGARVATAGQDGRVLIWDAEAGEVVHKIDIGGGWVENVRGPQMDNSWRCPSLAVSVSLAPMGKRFGALMIIRAR